jgi:hypothetical protein
MKRALVYPLATAVVALTAMSALAAWSTSANGVGKGKAKSTASMTSITATTNVATPTQATVTWTAPSVSSTNTTITGYRVVRWDAATNGTGSNVCAANLTSTALTCSDSPAVVPASYWYTVAAVFTRAGGTAPTWTGASTARARADVTALTVSTPALRTADDTGVSTSDGITKITTPHFTGTATAGATVKIFDGANQVGSGTATSGSYDIQVSALTASATGTQHTISATATVGSTTVNSPGSTTVTIDNAGPTVSSVTSANCTPSGASCTAGKGDDGDTVSVTFSEKVAEGLTGTQTMAVCTHNGCTSPSQGNGETRIAIPGLTSSSGIVIGTSYLASNNDSGTATGTFSVSANQLTIIYTLTSNLSHASAGASKTFTFTPDTVNITDLAGNVATGSASVTLQLF